MKKLLTLFTFVFLISSNLLVEARFGVSVPGAGHVSTNGKDVSAGSHGVGVSTHGSRNRVHTPAGTVSADKDDTDASVSTPVGGASTNGRKHIRVPGGRIWR